MSKCEKCKQEIKNKNGIIECPQCMNLFHLRCVIKRNIEFESFSGRKKSVSVNYYHCPKCGGEIKKKQI